MKKRLIAIICIICLAFTGTTAEASERNIKIAVKRLVERYPETHILPSVAIGIFIGESGGGHNNGRYYGNMSRRIYDVVESTDQFLDLMKKYGNVSKQKTWMGQLYAIQGHGYYGGASSHYISYVSGIIESRNLTKYDKKAKWYEKKLKEKKKTEKKKRLQKGSFRLVYDPSLLPWQVVTHRGIINGGTIRMDVDDHLNWVWMDVTKTKKGKKSVIYTGDLYRCMRHPVIRLSEVIENAKG